MTLKPLGLVVVAVSLATPLVWLPEIAQGRDIVALFSQYLGMSALIAMAISQLIATRIAPVEWVFGGMDRAYILHKWLGIGALAAILLHDTIDAEMIGLGRGTALVEVAETAGEVALYGLLILVIVTVATFIPYHLWRWTHRFIGVFFVFGAFHYLFILKPFSVRDPLGLYVATFCVLGIAAFTFRLLPARMRPSRRYEIAHLERTGKALAITMKPTGRALRYRPGQFVFVSFEGGEPHPFTISKAPSDDGSIRVTVASLGDFTSQLGKLLPVGTSVRVEGPYGRFERRQLGNPGLWIAGGIGITPFVAWAQAMNRQDAAATLVYCIRNENGAAHLQELATLADELPNFTLMLHTSEAQDRATAGKILEATGLDASDLSIAFCGPEPMRMALSKGFAASGVSVRRIGYEEFRIRSGIGLKAFAAYLMNRMTPSRHAPGERAG
ncbi:MAG: ferric reductase-like transmembrane domain-containing protein [Rhodobacteraceae bacterium]|nr:ferric reductase-like transmembrane domain-containing protein [Paracoccaceae bacterium]MCY4138255.1 ferric reductase-like transmembrane domain-containing protein [Paracoccaceae bacterium]